MTARTLDAFTGYGIEIEYMIVDRNDLSVRPIADKLLRDAAGRDASDVERGPLGWSNELARHVIEVKNLRPTADIDLLPQAFQEEVRTINALLRPHDAHLMPGAMHPWMNPRSDTALWPHDPQGIYDMYGRIFDTGTHGWANLQSMHVNLPFADDAQFARLHAAVRLALPLIPALAASSPVADGAATGFADFRMDVYRNNAEAFPSIAGRIIPETVGSRAEYEERILAPMYRAIAPYDRDRILQHEWLNSRGAIARFDRNTIEIRVIDVQECPRADLAVAALASAVVRALVAEAPASYEAQKGWHERELAAILLSTMRHGDRARIDDTRYLAAMGWKRGPTTAGALWAHLAESTWRDADEQRELGHAVELLLAQGCLAHRIRAALPEVPETAEIASVYRRLADCLAADRMFGADA